jgi:hypothetical protein
MRALIERVASGLVEAEANALMRAALGLLLDGKRGGEAVGAAEHWAAVRNAAAVLARRAEGGSLGEDAAGTRRHVARCVAALTEALRATGAAEGQASQLPGVVAWG